MQNRGQGRDRQRRDRQKGQSRDHPRGADLELEMTVPDGGPGKGQTWVVPDRVRVDLIRADGTRSRTYVSASSGRTFRFVVTRLQEPVTIELLAGDYRTRVPYRIEVVNPPGIDSMQLRCTYPEYTGWNQVRERSLIVTGSEVRLPIGTSFELTATGSIKTPHSTALDNERLPHNCSPKALWMCLTRSIPAFSKR